MWELFNLFCIGVFLLLGAWYAPKMVIAVILFSADLNFFAVIVMIMSFMTEFSVKFDKKDLDNIN